jgi:hypothetical protein
MLRKGILMGKVWVVTWIEVQEHEVWATVEADSEEEAIQKAEDGDYMDTNENYHVGIEARDFEATLQESEEE